MRLPSIDLVIASAARTARRFPLVLAAAAVATIAGLATTTPGSDTERVRLLVSATLGLPFLYALTVVAERTPGSPWRFIPWAGVAVLVAFWALWNGWSSPVQALRYVQLSLAFHLFAAFAPYTGSARPNGFWQYNRILFLRFLTAYLYTAVLFAGLAVALLAVEKLFGVKLPQNSYERLWIVIAFLFSTWFFLAGIPGNLAELDERTDYPTGLRIFAQYVLVPLVVLYLAILTLYLAKVVFTRQWPSGWIGYLVSSVAVVGLLSWLLVYPLEEREEYSWVKTYTKGFYIALMPAIVMLWLAIYERVAEYGLTEPRYFLIVLSVWLGGIALWYTFTRSRNIKLIPASLCALALVTFAGPTGAYSVSSASQSRRVDQLLARNGRLVSGRLQNDRRPVSSRDRGEISGSLRYLFATHGAGAIGNWLPDSLRRTFSATPSQSNSDFDARRLMAAMGMDYVAPGANGASEYFSFIAESSRNAMAIDGYTHALRLGSWSVRDSLAVGSGYVLRMSRDSTALQLSHDGAVALTVPLLPLVDSATAYQRAHGGMVPVDLMRVEVRDGGLAALAYMTTISGLRRADGAKITGIDGELFLKIGR